MTLKDIARETGVSISTVSRVINGKSNNAASKEVQDRIWAAARAGGYKPNEAAQTLKQKNSKPSSLQATRSIACIYARTNDASNDAFFSALTRSVEQEALKRGYIVKYSFTVFDIDSPLTRSLLRNNDVDGAVILGRCDSRTLTYLKKRFRKIVYTGLNILNFNCDQIICDGDAVASEAISYLLDLGHRRIGYVGDTQNEIRYDAYRKILHEHHIALDRSIVASCACTSEGGYSGTEKMLSGKNILTLPSALFCMNDTIAVGTIKAIQEKGLRVPGDISVISMDDIDIAQYMSPTLTTMHIPIADMGKITAKTLIERIEGEISLPMKIALPYRLVKRESCGKYNEPA